MFTKSTVGESQNSVWRIHIELIIWQETNNDSKSGMQL